MEDCDLSLGPPRQIGCSSLLFRLTALVPAALAVLAPEKLQSYLKVTYITPNIDSGMRRVSGLAGKRILNKRMSQPFELKFSNNVEF